MKNNTSIEMKKEIREDMLIAISIYDYQPVQGNCFDNEMLWAFINNQLTKNERLQAMRHLNSCSDCYGKWSEIVSDLPEKTGVYQKVSTYVADSYFKIAVSAAAAIIIVFTFFLFESPDIENLIDQSYQHALEKSILKRISPIMIPKLSSSLAFSSLSNPPEFTQFVAGIKNGQHMFSHVSRNNESVNVSSNETYFLLLGKWFFLTWQICHSDDVSNKKELWNRQITIAEMLSESVPKESSALKKLWNQVLEAMNSQLPTQNKNQQMTFYLENMILLLKE